MKHSVCNLHASIHCRCNLLASYSCLYSLDWYSLFWLSGVGVNVFYFNMEAFKQHSVALFRTIGIGGVNLRGVLSSPGSELLTEALLSAT